MGSVQSIISTVMPMVGLARRSSTLTCIFARTLIKLSKFNSPSVAVEIKVHFIVFS